MLRIHSGWGIHQQMNQKSYEAGRQYDVNTLVGMTYIHVYILG